MAFKSVALPLLSGAVLIIGYVAFSRLRPGGASVGAVLRSSVGRRGRVAFVTTRSCVREQALDVDLDLGLITESDVDAPQSNEHASESASVTRALFIARVTEALSPFPRIVRP